MNTPGISSAELAAHERSRSKSFWHLGLLILLIVVLSHSAVLAQNTVVLVGIGSSVPAPLYNRWTQDYGKLHAGVQIRYVPTGTSEGIKSISQAASDFGAGEAQLTDKERKDGGLLQLPIVLIGIVPI
ncbi:MAG: substrate-binding domain-containing protein, partial [Candidatus Acidiferrales bacterium]